MDRKNIIFSLILIVFIVFTFFRFSKNLKKYFMASASFLITTEKTEYAVGDNLRLKIKNNYGRQLCFSTCYPYFLERKDKTWQRYSYVECSKINIHNGCIQNGIEKAFELTLPRVQGGLHRLVVPFCADCNPDDNFKAELNFYSNEFIIKE
jgi:hypothetical protein